MDESYLEWLRVLPGLSAEAARKVVERFPTFEHLRAATDEELASVEGLSPRDREALHSLLRDPSGRDSGGYLYLCPECGSFAGTRATECPFCGVHFGDESASGVDDIDAFLREEDAPAVLCQSCGATMAPGAARCEICGRAYTPDQLGRLPGIRPDLDVAAHLCPHCGAYLAAEATECVICGVERHGPAVPANGHNGKGVAEGFLNRWQRVAEVVPVSEMERLREELEQADRLLEVDPSLERVWAKRGRTLAKMGRAADAAESLAKAAELNPAKDEAYRLEVLDILQARGDLSFLPPRWVQPKATAAPTAVDPRLVDALHHYDALLHEDPNLVVAWRTKGEILERLGRGDEAKVCLERADRLEHHEDELLRASALGLRAPGLTSPLAGSTGRINGAVRGQVNGRTNGRVNGVVEGRVNGLTNGAAAGLGLARGATNGLRGFTNGRTNGLVNGNGFTNGRRGRSGASRLAAQPHWARSVIGIAAVVALMVLVPVLASLLSPTPGPYAPIAIDHNFGEWATYAAYVNAPPATQNNPDINILEVKVATDPSNLYVYAKVQGLLFQAPWANGTESLFIFIDTDRSAATGYPIGGMGADLLAVVTGWDGEIRSTVRYAFNESSVLSSNDFRRFVPAGSVDAAFLGAQFEARIPLDTDPAQARVLVYGIDNQGNQDAMVGLVQPGHATVVVAQKTVAPGVVTNRTSPILALSLSPMGGVPSVSSLTVARRGSSVDPVTVDVYRDAGTGVFSLQDPILGSAILSGSETTVPLNLTVGSPTNLWVTATWTNMTPLRTLGLRVAGLAGNGTASFRPADTTLDYQVAAPSTVTVDGAFADWAGHPYGQNPLGSVVGPAGSLVYDANVDLLATAVDLQANLTGYAQVAGIMLGGDDIPVNVLRPAPYTPPTNTTPPPAPYVPEVGYDVVYAYIDADNSSMTGIRYQVGNRTYGFDYAVATKGRNGQVNSSALYVAGVNDTWQYVGPAAAALDSHRLEFAVNASALNLRVGYQVVYVASDWKLEYDVASPNENVASFTLSTFAKPPSKNPPIISIVKTVSAQTAVPGQTLTYLIYFNNTGGLAKTVWINDTMPGGVTYVSASAAPATNTGSTYGWVFTNVAPGSQHTLQITVQVNGNGADGSSQLNTATLAYTDQKGFLAGRGTASAAFTYQRPVIAIAKTVSPTNAVPGQTVTYTIYYNNTGSVAAGTVSIVDTLPNGLVFVSSSATPTAHSGQTYYWNFTNVPHGSYSFTITALVSNAFTGTQLVNWAFLNYTSTQGFRLTGSSASAVVAIPELGDFLFVAAVPFLVIGLRIRAKRSREPMEKKKGVADSVPRTDGR